MFVNLSRVQRDPAVYRLKSLMDSGCFRVAYHNVIISVQLKLLTGMRLAIFSTLDNERPCFVWVRNSYPTRSEGRNFEFNFEYRNYTEIPVSNYLDRENTLHTRLSACMDAQLICTFYRICKKKNWS